MFNLSGDIIEILKFYQDVKYGIQSRNVYLHWIALDDDDSLDTFYGNEIPWEYFIANISI